MQHTLLTFALRFHLFWILFYSVLIGSTVAYANHLYTVYDTDQLPRGAVELATDKERYQLGEEVVFTVTNHFPTPIYVTNHCPDEPLWVFRWEDETWTQIHARTPAGEEECASKERNVAIAPESQRTYSFNDWPELFLEPGVYRIALKIEHYNDVPFKDFVILQEPETIEILKEPTYIYRTEPAPQPPNPIIEQDEGVVYDEEEDDDDVYEYEREEHEEEDEHEHEEEDDDD